MISKSFTEIKYLSKIAIKKPFIAQLKLSNVIYQPILSRKFSEQQQQEQQIDNFIEDMKAQFSTIKGLSDFTNMTKTLTYYTSQQQINLSQILECHQNLFENFPKLKELSHTNEIEIQQLTDVLVIFYQSNIESLSPELILQSAKVLCNYKAHNLKAYWHFIEFLLTRTEFIRQFNESQAVELLCCYYEIESSLEWDKFQYIFDKFEEFILSRSDLELTHHELSTLIYLYIKCNFGGQGFFEKLHDEYEVHKERMDIKDLVRCAWGIVSFNVRAKSKLLKVYDTGVHKRITDNINELDSYLLKNFLWSYDQEQKIFANEYSFSFKSH